MGQAAEEISDGDSNSNVVTQNPIVNAENIQILFNRADSQPLYVDVTLEGYSDKVYDCLVDNGACVSLIRSSVVDELIGVHKHPSTIRTISGIGHTAIKISHFVILTLHFRSGFSTTETEFYVVPSEFLGDSLVLGVPLLRANSLLPDMSTYQLLLRDEDKLLVVASDPTKSDTIIEPRTTENLEVGPHQCGFISINLCNFTYSLQNFYLEGLCEENFHVLPGILREGDPSVVAIYNGSESPRFIPKGFSVGSAFPITETTDISIFTILPGEPEGASMHNDYWTREKIMEEFQFSDIQVGDSQKEQLINLLQKYSSVLSTGDDDVGLAHNVQHHIELTSDRPIHVPVRRFQGPLAQEIERQCCELEEGGIIRKSHSPYSAPVVPVRKKDGSLRLCVDYRALNKHTKGDAFPLPNLIDSIYNMAGAQFFTTIDLVRGYYQIEMAEGSIEKTAFSTPLSHYEFLRMPFGVKGGPATFQRGMMMALSGIPWSEVMAYLDDVIIRSSTFEQHILSLEKVLRALNANGFKLKPSKTKLCRESVDFLGHRIDNRGILPLEKNLSGVLDFPIPSTVKQLRQFLGMVNFYRRHIPHCSSIAKPLSCQTGGRTVQWTEKCQEAFEKLKSSLVDPRLLAFPDYSLNSPPLELFVDASDIGAGAVLSQQQGDDSRPIAFISMTFSDAQRKYSTVERELAALRWAVKALRPFLCNEKEFIIYSDHEPLQYLHNMSTADGRIARTLEELSEYNFQIRHISGRKNILADALSRSPVPVIESEPVDMRTEGTFKESYIPQGFKQITVPGGGDSLFRCFAIWLEGSEGSHIDMRERLVTELIKDPRKYNLHGRNLLKRLRLMAHPGQVPIPEIIQAFANLMRCKALVYYTSAKPLVYGEGFTDTCYLSCVSGIHYNLLIPEENVNSVSDIVSINLVRIHSKTSHLQIHSTLLQNSSVDMDTLKHKQQTDRVLKSLSRVVVNKVLKEQWPKNLTAFRSVAEHIFISEGLLLVKHKNEDKFIVPFSYMVSLATQFHIDYGHLGRNKLLSLIYEELWNPRVNQIVSDICRSCPHCQVSKTGTNIARPPMLKISSSFPYELLAVDLLQLPRTSRNNGYCLVAIDHYSKFINVVPLVNKTSQVVANAFKHKILPFLTYIPDRLLSDRGLEFMGEPFEEVLHEFGIEHVVISSHMPQCNGVTERVNRTLLQILRTLAQDSPSSWDNQLPQAVILYNNTWHSAIDATPSDTLLKNPHSFRRNPCLQQFWRDPSKHFSPYREGDKVAYKVHMPGNLVINKFKSRYVGPFTIRQAHDNDLTYVISRVSKPHSEIRAHYSQLRPWIEVPRYLRDNPHFKQLLSSEEVDDDHQTDDEVRMDEEIEIMDIEDDHAAEPEIFNSLETECEESDFLGFEVHSTLSLNEYLGFTREYCNISMPRAKTPTVSSLGTFHTPPFKNMNITPTITPVDTTFVVSSCHSVETYLGQNLVRDESDVEVGLNLPVGKESESSLSSSINSCRMSADLAHLQALCQSTEGSIIVNDSPTIENERGSQPSSGSDFEGFTTGRVNTRDVRDILGRDSLLYNLRSPENEMRTRVVETIVTTTISTAIGHGTRSHGPVPEYIHVLDKPLEYMRKHN